MADRVIAQRVLADANQRCRRVIPAHSQTGLTATPVFHQFQLSTVEHILDATSLSHVEVAVHLATPVMWTCNGLTAPSAQLALSLGDKARSRYQTRNVAAVAQAQALGLPLLSGTEKQRAWANQIRARHATDNPNSVYLKSKLLAAWWIENQRAL